MNTKLMQLIGLALCSQSIVENSTGGTSPNPNALSVDTLAAMADKNNPVPAGRSWMNEGLKYGQSILAAEQAAKIAEQTEESTRVDVLKFLITIPESVSRAQFIAGVDNAFIAVGKEGRKSKGHSNYLAEMRRVSSYFTTMAPSGNPDSDEFKAATVQALNWLNATQPNSKLLRKYGERLAMFPTTGNQGGSNKGQSNAAVIPAAQQQSNAAAALAAAPAGSESQSQTQVGHATASYNREQLIAGIKTAHEDDLESAYIALANRLKMSPADKFKNWGLSMLDNIEQPENLPIAANG